MPVLKDTEASLDLRFEKYAVPEIFTAVRPEECELAQDGVEYRGHVVGLGKQSSARLKIPLNVSTEDVFENVVELPPIPCNEFQSEQPQGARVSPSKPRAKKERLTTVVKIFMKACKNAWGLWARKQSLRLLLLS
ncbi:hypothetical protein TNIN_62811 [Trichonephila inaurata madagascariensis]|uniref:Uncharacterized protein n=1 Tax=Trichonephila inaurata madagascariensis TaxID=2747483 RepID=A0A8X7BWB7_9ARAC|nr:hypothetical protein TNIN_62811 [Trichonephila inaurata madagascariensis]